MKLNLLRLENFFSYKKETIPFTNDGIYIIYGYNKQTKEKNGIGKSAIKEAIKFALFGKSRTNNLDDVIRFGANKTAVQLDFSIREEDYRIIRIRKRNKNSTLRLIKAANANNKITELTCSTIKQTQLEIENLIGIDYDKFMHSFCFGQSEYDDLKQLTSSKLIDFLKSILDLERFNRYYDIVKEKSIDTDNKINELSGEKNIYDNINSISKSKQDLKSEKEDYKNKIKELKDKIKETQDFLNSRESDLNEDKSKLKKFQVKIKDYTKKSKFIEENAKCPLCKTNLKNTNLLISLDKKLKKLKSKKDNILEDVEIRENNLKEYREEIQTYKENLIEFKSNIKEVNSKLKNLKMFQGDSKKVDKKLKRGRKLKGLLEKTKDVFSPKGLPLFVLEIYIPKLEYSINNILSKVTDFKLNLKTKKRLKSSNELRNTCEIELFKGNKKYPLENLSNGEELLITLAVRIGISRIYKLESPFETLILDECFGSLGDVNKQKVLTLINDLENTFSRIIIISHVDSIRNWSKPYKINIIKDQDISYLNN